MLYGTLPFNGDTEEETIEKIINAPLRFPQKIPVTTEAKDLIKSMLNKDPTKRTTLLEVMSSPYFLKDEDELSEQVKKLSLEAEEVKAKEEEKALEK